MYIEVGIQFDAVKLATNPSPQTLPFQGLLSIMPDFMKWAELPARDDIYQDKGTTKWGNHDLYPIVPSERTYGRGAFLLYWVTCGAGLSTFAIGSSYIAVGLTPGEACGAVLIGSCLSSGVAILCGRAGAEKHLGYVGTLDQTLALSLTSIDYDGSCLFRTSWNVASSFLSAYEQRRFRKAPNILAEIWLTMKSSGSKPSTEDKQSV